MSELVETLRICASKEQIVRHYHVALAQRQEDEIEALRARLEKAEAERDEAHAWIKDATTKITGLTAGGSEYFTKHGDAYWADVDFCVTRIRERYETSHGQVIKAHKRVAAARYDALEEAAKEVAGLKPLLGTGWIPPVANVLKRAAEAIRALKSPTPDQG